MTINVSEDLNSSPRGRIPYTITISDMDPLLWKALKKEAFKIHLTTAQLATQILKDWVAAQKTGGR